MCFYIDSIFIASFKRICLKLLQDSLISLQNEITVNFQEVLSYFKILKFSNKYININKSELVICNKASLNGNLMYFIWFIYLISLILSISN